MEMERLGLPTVTIVTSKFEDLANISKESHGMPDLSMVTVPHPFELIPMEQVEAKADSAFQNILEAATQLKPISGETRENYYPAQTVNVDGSIEYINDFLFTKGWSMGIPMIPASREQVDLMLKGTDRRPDELLWIVPPRGGALTVELVAVHAVMAGAKPEYMPVILSIIDAMKEDEFEWKSCVTTSAQWPVVIVNGPIAKKLNIACGTGVGGGGYKANVSIGLTISSIIYVVGGAKYPTPNMSQVGIGAEIVPPIMAECEDELPEGWVPFHVEQGYKKTDNVVSVKACRGFDMFGENGQKAEDMLWSFAKNLDYGKECFYKGETYLIIPPTPAAMLAKEGWTKDKIRNYLWENARSPISWWRRSYPRPALSIAQETEGFAQKYGPITPDTLIPMVDKPEKYKIVVIGGPGTHCYYYQGTHGRLVSKLIR